MLLHKESRSSRAAVGKNDRRDSTLTNEQRSTVSPSQRGQCVVTVHRQTNNVPLYRPHREDGTSKQYTDKRATFQCIALTERTVRRDNTLGKRKSLDTGVLGVETTF